MLEPRKKIRQLMSELDSALNKGEASKEISELVQQIEKIAPERANSVFQTKLKNTLLSQHKTMAKSKTQEEKKFSLWSDFRMRGWVMAMGALILAVLAGVVSYPFIPAPTVMGYEMKNNLREISYNAPIQITFNQWMNNSSVEQNLKFEPALPGKVSWKGNTMTYTPDQQLKIGDVYQMSIGRGAVSLLQKPLSSDYSEQIRVVDAPKVILITPNQPGTPVDSEINIMFDHPVSGLTKLEEGEKNIPNIKIEPAVNGRWRWIGTSAIQFIPEKLNLATTYTVTVPKDLKLLDGASTTEEAVSTFETARPAVEMMVSDDAAAETIASTNSHFKLTFNQKVNLGSAKNLVKLQLMDGDKFADAAFDVHYYNSEDWKADQKFDSNRVDMATYEEVPEAPADEKTVMISPIEQPKTEELEKTLVIVPGSKLIEGKSYRIVVPEGVQGAEGPLGTTTERIFTTNVAGALEMTGMSQNFDMDELGIPEFSFNNQLDLRSLRGKVKISPENYDEDKKPIAPTIWGASGFSVSYKLRPAIEYKVEVAAGVKDVFGHSYDKPIEFKFITPDYKPTLNLESGTDINILDGYKPSVFYVKTTNVDEAKVQLKKLSPEQFLKYYGNGWVDYQALNLADNEFDKTENLPIKLAKNVRGHTELNLDKWSGSKLESGFYMLQVSSPKVLIERCTYEGYETKCKQGPKLEKNLFVVSKSALVSKQSSESNTVWMTDLSTGKPVEGAKVKIVGQNLTKAEGTTDLNGVAKMNGADLNGLLIAEREGDTSILHDTWSEGVAPWNFNIDATAGLQQYYMYLYTERPIYRPGQDVEFKGILRQEKEYKFHLPEVKSVKVTATDSIGNQVYEKELPLSKNGTFSGKLSLGEAVATGDYSLQAELVYGEKMVSSYPSTFWANFKVYEYKKPEYKLDITPEQKDYVNGQTAKIKVQAGYFFGAPLKDAQVNWTVKSEDYYFIIPEELAAKFSGWFSFAEEGFFCYWTCRGESAVVAQGTAKTDAEGIAEVNLPLSLGDKKMSQIYTLEATVSDANNQSVANRVNFPVHQGDFYLGVRSQDYVLDENKPAKFEAVTLTNDGKILANKTFDATIYSRSWNTVKRKNVDGGFYYENSYEDKEVEKKAVTSDGEGRANFEFTLKKGGEYKVQVSAKDARGNLVRSSTSVYVGGGDFINWGSENNDRIELVNDKMEYQVGDTAKILIKSPYKGVYALVTFEKDKILEQKVVKLESNSQTIEVPITEKFLPNAFVSVVVMKGDAYDAGLKEPIAGAIDERQVASFKVGYTTLQVNTEGKRLNVEIKANKAQYAPGEEVTLTVKTTDSAGRPIPAELSLGVVDESVLSLTESVTADLMNVFYRKRMLGVYSAFSLTKALSRINVVVEAGEKGGGGGGVAKRGIFKDTAHFESNLMTGSNGEGTVTFKLPDNLTTWQVMAIGISDDSTTEKTLVGSNKMNFLVTKDILVRPVLPRFMTGGDEMEISAIVHNYTDKDQPIKVSLEAPGLELKDGVDKSANVPKNGSEKVSWKIKVGNIENVKLSFSAIANGGEKGDSVEQVLPVKQPSFPTNVATSRVVDSDVINADKVWLPANLDLSRGKLTIKASATLAGSINDGLLYLLSYPYGCTEQLASAILPNVTLEKLIKTGKFKTAGISEDEVKKNVSTGLQQLYLNQKANGGFGLWMDSEDNAYLTAYVLYTLSQAKSAGFTVDEKVINNSVSYLDNYIRNTSLEAKGTFYDKAAEERYIANTRAYVLFVMSEIGKGDLGLTKNLYKVKDRLSLASTAYLMMTLQTLKEPAKDLKEYLQSNAKQTTRGVAFEERNLDYRIFDTNTRTTAIVMLALFRENQGNPLVPKILQALLQERQAGHFLTTQDTAVNMLTLIEYFEKSGELDANYQGLVLINGESVLDEAFKSDNLFESVVKEVPLNKLLSNNLDNEIASKRNGKGKMYLDLNLEYFLPLEALKAKDQGIGVIQEYFAQNDEKMTQTLNTVKVGENLHGRITVVVPKDSYYVMIEDFLPAGLEGIDFNLKTSEQNLQDGKGGECYEGECYNNWYFNHEEVRDDRMMYFADYLPKGVYEIDYYVRATSVGSFADLPTLAQETYFPEVFGRSEGKQFKITE